MFVGRILRFVTGMAGAFLPYRYWPRLPPFVLVHEAAFLSGLFTLFAGAAIGIPGFLEHAHMTTSLGIDAQLGRAAVDPNAGYSQGLSQGFSALAIFTFLLLTPKGWATLYLMIGGGLRAAAAWFDDPIGDPILTGVDAAAASVAGRARAQYAQKTREAAEGPNVPDRVVTGAAAGIPDCDFVIVASRQKPGWEHGAAVYTQNGCYRIGLPIQRTIAGHVRYLYPLTEHKDHEAIRKSVRYDLPQ